MAPRTDTEIGGLIGLCGLTQDETAVFLGVAAVTVRKWCRGEYRPPDTALARLTDLWSRITSLRNVDLSDAPAGAQARRQATLDARKRAKAMAVFSRPFPVDDREPPEMQTPPPAGDDRQ